MDSSVREEAMEPPYEVGDVNEPITLFSGRGQLEGVRGNVSVELRFKPVMRTVAELKPDSGELALQLIPSWADYRDPPLELDGVERNVPVLRSSITTGSVGPVELGDANQALDRVVFFVVNLGDLMGRGNGFAPVDAGDGRYMGQRRATLCTQQWRIELDSRAGLSDVLEELAIEGGYAVTHVGRLRRVDGAAFLPSDVDHVLSGLHVLLTFAFGSWVTPTTPVGYDGAGNTVWRQWGDRISADWRQPLSWLDRVHAGGLVEIVGQFFEQWDNPCWRQVLQRAVGTYIEANASGGHRPAMLDTRLLLAGTGLELLAWAILDGGCDDPNAEEDKDALDKRVRRLLRKACIEPAIPTQLPALRKLAREHGWHDGPAAVAQARHRIAHPRQRSETAGALMTLEQRPLFEAWRLAIEYLELLLLHRLNYQGLYARNLDVSQRKLEQVPWARA